VPGSLDPVQPFTGRGVRIDIGNDVSDARMNPGNVDLKRRL
jgi:hypothetical protein